MVRLSPPTLLIKDIISEAYILATRVSGANSSLRCRLLRLDVCRAEMTTATIAELFAFGAGPLLAVP